MVKNFKIDNITICGGSLCIDFINTVKDRMSRPVDDYFSGFDDFLYWAERLKIINNKQYKSIERNAKRQKEEAGLYFEDAIAYRETLFELFLAISKGKKVAPHILESSNQMFAAYLPYLKLIQHQNKFIENWSFDEGSFKNLLAPVVNDCYELLLSGKTDRIKDCPKCGWIFLDTTKNGRRRWCTMKTCGSSVKALEWYHRQKK